MTSRYDHVVASNYAPFSLHKFQILTTIDGKLSAGGKLSTAVHYHDPGWAHPRYLAQLAMWRIYLC